MAKLSPISAEEKCRKLAYGPPAPVRARRGGHLAVDRDDEGALRAVAMGTKAETLARLEGRLVSADCLPQSAFTVADWRRSPEEIVAKVLAAFPGVQLIVRSSARGEDSLEQSNAGAFESRLDVPSSAPAVKAAIEAVIASYGPAPDEGDQVLVQPQLRDVARSGVVFSHTLSGEPYFVVESDATGRTDVVTSGTSAASGIVYVRHGADVAGEPAYIQQAVELTEELQRVLDSRFLDIEFAIDGGGRMFLLQVRPLVAALKSEVDASTAAYEAARRAVSGLTTRAAGVAGPSTVYSDMADWNPAELVGGRPRELALSLFHHLITDTAWRAARGRLGYVDPPDTELLKVVAGHPYIDVRASLNSLLPSGMSEDLRERVVAEAIALLESNVHLHDKVEFSIAPAAFTATFTTTFARYADRGFTPEEIAQITGAVREHTLRLIRGEQITVANLLEETRELDRRRAQLLAAEPDDLLGAAETLIAGAREGGFPVFGAVARLAFIAAATLRGFIDGGALLPERADEFMRSLQTVAGELTDQLVAYRRGEVPLEAILERFGHLRPGTFDITSRRYDEDPSTYLGSPGDGAAPPSVAATGKFAWTSDELTRVSELLSASEMPIDARTVLAFVADATVAREEAKFIVSRHVSDALKLITTWGEQHGLSRDELSHLRLADLLALRGEPDPATRGHEMAAAGEARYAANRTVLVPDVITGPDDLAVVRYNGSQPNFCGGTRVVRRPILIDNAPRSEDISGQVVLIESADPGFDWILTRDIAGLITRYGGAASHMAIRCAEFGLPAAIGVGARFEALAQAARVDLDPANRRVEALT